MYNLSSFFFLSFLVCFCLLFVVVAVVVPLIAKRGPMTIPVTHTHTAVTSGEVIIWCSEETTNYAPCTQTNTHTRARAHTHTHERARAHTYTHIRTRAHVRTHRHRRLIRLRLKGTHTTLGVKAPIPKWFTSLKIPNKARPHVLLCACA